MRRYRLNDGLNEDRTNNDVSVYRNSVRDGSGDFRGFIALMEHPFIQVVGNTPSEALFSLAEAHRQVADAIESLAMETTDTDVE